MLRALSRRSDNNKNNNILTINRNNPAHTPPPPASLLNVFPPLFRDFAVVGEELIVGAGVGLLVGGLVVFSVFVPLVFYLDFDGLEDDAAVDGGADGATHGLKVSGFDGLEDGVFDGGAVDAADQISV